MIRSITVSGPTAASRILSGAVVDISAAQNGPIALSAVANDEHGAPISPPNFLWTSTNPNAVAVVGSGSTANVTRKVQAPTDLATEDSNGVQSDGSEVGALATIECEALRADGSQSGVIGLIRVVVQSAGYGHIKAANGGLIGGNLWPNQTPPAPTSYSIPTNLV